MFGHRDTSPAARAERRTRTGLLLTAIGLFLSWVPVAAVFGALFLSSGSTLLVLGARAHGRRHEVAVLLAFLVLTVAGVIVAMMVGAFLIISYNAASAGAPLVTLQPHAYLMVWVTLPATVALAAGIAMQVHWLLPSRGRRRLLGYSVLLVATSVVATWWASSDVAVLSGGPVTASAIVDFLIRVSFDRVIELPAYVGLGALYLLRHWEAAEPTEDAPSELPGAPTS